MKPARLLYLWTACCLVGSWAGAQDPSDGGAPRREIEEIKPGTSVLIDESGNWVEVPGFSLEQYLELVRRKKILPAATPPYSLEQVVVTGEARGGQAELKVKVTILITEEDQPARIPLELGESVLRMPSPAAYDGEGWVRIEYSGQERKYYCVLRGEAESRHEVELRVAARIREDRGGQRLAVRLPAAPKTTFEFTTPQAPIEADVIKGTFVRKQVRRQGEGSRILLEGTGGELQFVWREGRSQIAPVKPFFSSTVTIQTRVRSQVDVTSRAELEVTTFGTPLESFDVRLPPGMKLIPRDAGVEVLEPLDAQTPGSSEVVRVTFDGAQSSPIKVELLAALAPVSQDGRFEALGFEVLDAVSQQGSVTVVAEHGWTARPLQTANVTRTSVSAEPGQEAWRFVFASKPHSLQLQVQPSQSRVRIEPTYILYVVRGQVRLQARLQCTVRGATDSGTTLALSLPGWTVSGVTPERLVDSEVLTLAETDPLQIPLIRQQDAPTTFVIQVQAARSLAEQSKLQIVLPRPVELEDDRDTMVTTGPAQVIVAAADNIELIPEKMEGLSEDTLAAQPADLGLPRLQQTPLSYNALPAEQPARFEARLLVHSRSVRAEAVSRLTVDDEGFVQVRQLLKHRIAHESLQHLLFDVDASTLSAAEPRLEESPGGAARRRNLVAQFQGEDVTYEIVPQEGLAPGRVAIRVALPEPQIGQCDVEISYDVARPPPKRSTDGSSTTGSSTDGRSTDGNSTTGSSTDDRSTDDRSTDDRSSDGNSSDGNSSDGNSSDGSSSDGSSSTSGEPQPITVPLARPLLSDPADVDFHRVEVAGPPGLRLKVQGDAWTTVEEPLLSSDLTLMAEGHDSSITLLPARQHETQGSSVVTQMWLQTWLHKQRRRDRVVFRLQTNRRRVLIQLPQRDELVEEDLKAAVDGREVALEFDPSTRRVTVELPTAAGEYVVELWYWLATSRSWQGATVIPPSLPHAGASGRVYWQAALPRSQFLLQGPPEMTADMAWRLRQGVLQRTSLSQRDLEQWIGASQQDPLPSGVRTYLFASFGRLPALRVRTISHGRLVLLVAGITLLVGLGLIYVPALRKPPALLLAGLALLASATAWPACAMMASQAVALGVLLATLAKMLDWMFSRRRATRRRSSGDSDTWSYPTGSILAEASHATATTATAVPAGEGKP